MLRNLIVVLFLVIAVSNLGAAIDCYKCNSTENINCGDPFEDDDIKSHPCIPLGSGVESFKCGKSIIKSGSKNITVRDCIYEGATTGGGNCVDLGNLRIKGQKPEIIFCDTCDSDLCNGANKIPDILSTFVLIITFGYIML